MLDTNTNLSATAYMTCHIEVEYQRTGHLLGRTRFPTCSCNRGLGARCTPRYRRSLCTGYNRLPSCQRKGSTNSTHWPSRMHGIRTPSYVPNEPERRNHFRSHDHLKPQKQNGICMCNRWCRKLRAFVLCCWTRMLILGKPDLLLVVGSSWSQLQKHHMVSTSRLVFGVHV